MAQKYKVFIDGKCLLITSPEFSNESSQDFKIYNNVDSFLNEESVYDLQNSSCVVCENPKEAFKKIKEQFVFIKAAGGIVEFEGKFLFIKRLGKWDLPKGKMDAGEKPRETAMREIAEECNLSGHAIAYKIVNTYHTYEQNGENILKKTAWYHLNLMAMPKEKLAPQQEEGITELRWFSWGELDEVRQNTYVSILDVLDELAKMQGFER
jgi:ADP-ribose pyrophosphatase YjhB (NUDIX family)